MEIKLRYDGKWIGMDGEPRQWTIMSHFVDANGADRFHGSFGLGGLKEIGVITGGN